MKTMIPEEFEKPYRGLSAHTKLALDAFRRVLVKERSLDKVNKELEKWVSRIPDSDMERYVKMSEAMRKKYEE